MSAARAAHLKVVRKPFKLDCDGAVFSETELELLARYGSWLTALENGELEPYTEEQQRFLRVLTGDEKPSNEIQAVWLKYKLRKQALADMAEVPHYVLRDERESWYSEKAYKRGIHFPRGGG